MTGISRFPWKLVVKWTWIGLNLFVLQFGLGACFTDSGCYYIQTDVFPYLLLLGFPSGFIAVLLAATVLAGHATASDFTILWLATFIGGYVQWFVLLPLILKSSKPLTLGLSELERTPLVCDLSVPQRKSARSRRVWIGAAAIPQFDKKGQTPLERAIRSASRRR
jgi:hypothetical protein